MIDIVEYLLQSDQEEILNTWASTGSVTVNNNTKIYSQGSIIKIDGLVGRIPTEDNPAPELHNQMLYVQKPYIVDNNLYKPIDWNTMTIDDVSGMFIASEGIQLPYFVVLPTKWTGSFIEDYSFIPFQNNLNNDAAVYNNGGIQISDEELERILVDIGLPFLNFQEIEYTKAEIARVCIYAALQRFYTFFPIVDEECGLSVSKNSPFEVEFPENAYAVIPFYTSPGVGGGSNSEGSPFAIYNEMQLSGGVGTGFGKYGRGVQYIGKQTPGYTNMHWRTQLMDRRQIAQATINYFRREKYKRVKKEDGKYYATGFSTTGGNLNFKWLKWSKDWDDIPFELILPIARPMAKIEVLKAFSLLRNLVKTDLSGQLDPTVLSNMAQKYEDELKPILNTVSTTGVHSLMRGGG